MRLVVANTLDHAFAPIFLSFNVNNIELENFTIIHFRHNSFQFEFDFAFEVEMLKVCISRFQTNIFLSIAVIQVRRQIFDCYFRAKHYFFAYLLRLLLRKQRIRGLLFKSP